MGLNCTQQMTLEGQHHPAHEQQQGHPTTGQQTNASTECNLQSPPAAEQLDDTTDVTRLGDAHVRDSANCRGLPSIGIRHSSSTPDIHRHLTFIVNTDYGRQYLSHSTYDITS